MKQAVNDIDIHYELTGDPEKPVVMLSHSLATDMTMWDFQMDALLDRYRVLRFDTRGHGKSDAPEGSYTMEQLVDDAVKLLDALSIDRVYFVGLSMGGMIGQGFALEHGSRLNGLVLSSTAAIMGPETQPIWQERIDSARKDGMSALVQGTLERWFTPAYLSQSAPGVKSIKKMVLNTPVSGFIGCSEAIRRLGYLNQLSRVNIPTLIMVGEGDPGTPVAASQAIHSQIKGSLLEIVPNAYHMCNIEQKDTFNGTLLQFLIGLESS